MSLPRIDIMPVDFEPLPGGELSPAEQFVYDWIADPTAVLAEIFEGCMNNPQDLCEIGRATMAVYAKFDQERIECERQLEDGE